MKSQYPRILTVTYEQLGRANPDAIRRLARFLGVRVPRGQGASVRLAERIIAAASRKPVVVPVPNVAAVETP